MKKYLIIIACVISCYSLSAQNTGYAGKHFILKTDAMNGKFLGGRNAEVEYAFMRRFTLSAGFRYQNAKYKQTYNARDVSYITHHDYGYIGEHDQFIKNLPDATIKAYTVKLQLKYFLSRVIAAPKGFFTYLSFEAGKASVVNTVQLGSVYNSWGGSVDYFIYTKGPDLYKVNVKQYELGVGYQEILLGFIALEGSLALNMSRFNGDGGGSQQYTTAVASYYGPNLLPFGKNMGKYGGGHNMNPHAGGFGLALYLKVGFLLF